MTVVYGHVYVKPAGAFMTFDSKPIGIKMELSSYKSPFNPEKHLQSQTLILDEKVRLIILVLVHTEGV